MQTALADEKAQIEKMPFTEDEIAEALDLLRKKTRPPPRHSAEHAGRPAADTPCRASP